MKKIILFLFLILLIGCTYEKNKIILPMSKEFINDQHSESLDTIQNQSINNIVLSDIKPKKVGIDVLVPFDYKFILDLHGIAQFDAEKLIYIVNKSYFDDLRVLTLINSNYNATKSYIEGFYIENEITIYIDPQWDSKRIKKVLLHELKHHWCWINKHELDINSHYVIINNQSYYTHDGCFLNTSIDKEYGFIQ